MGRKLYSFVHFEAVVPSTVYFLELEQDPQNGDLKVIQQMVRRLKSPARCSSPAHFFFDSPLTASWQRCGGAGRSLALTQHLALSTASQPPDGAYTDVTPRCGRA